MALAAVNLVMPLLMIITALAEMIATGSSVRISILLGQGNKDPI
jgi:Na+-driven multidrug efflux pump